MIKKPTKEQIVDIIVFKKNKFHGYKKVIKFVRKRNQKAK